MSTLNNPGHLSAGDEVARGHAVREVESGDGVDREEECPAQNLTLPEVGGVLLLHLKIVFAERLRLGRVRQHPLLEHWHCAMCGFIILMDYFSINLKSLAYG